jgi:hypothetical protein
LLERFIAWLWNWHRKQPSRVPARSLDLGAQVIDE